MKGAGRLPDVIAICREGRASIQKENSLRKRGEREKVDISLDVWGEPQIFQFDKRLRLAKDILFFFKYCQLNSINIFFKIQI